MVSGEDVEFTRLESSSNFTVIDIYYEATRFIAMSFGQVMVIESGSGNSVNETESGISGIDKL